MRTIDFFEEKNKQSTNQALFGLCDDVEGQPAYIDTDLSNKNVKWIGIVKNQNEKQILFYPVDHCVDLKTEDGKMAQRCEGILYLSDNNLIFTELKDRKILPAVWLKDAQEQIIETLSHFFKYYESGTYKIKAWICNKQLTNPNYYKQINEFKEITKEKFRLKKGLVLFVERTIKI